LDTISSHKAAAYFGVCAADIGYLSTYGKTQQALNYMDVCLKLSKAVEGWDVNNSDVSERFERNLSNPDSLIQILNQFNNNVIRYSLEHEHRDLGLLMVFGAFIESQYITTQIINNFPEDMLPDDIRWELISIFMGQKKFLRDLIDEFEYLEGKEDWEHATLNSLTELYRTYTRPMSPLYPPPEPHHFTRILILSEKIKKIRANIIF
jgi:hypothetical protein